MSVVKDLQRIHGILLKISKMSNCAEITDYDPYSIKIFAESLSKSIARYRKEALRQRKYYRPGGV